METKYNLKGYYIIRPLIPDSYVIPVFVGGDIDTNYQVLDRAFRANLFKDKEDVAHALVDPPTDEEYEVLCEKFKVLHDPDKAFPVAQEVNLKILKGVMATKQAQKEVCEELDRLTNCLCSLGVQSKSHSISGLITDKIKVAASLLNTALEELSGELKNYDDRYKMRKYDFVYTCTHQEKFSINATSQEEAMNQAQDYVENLSVNQMYQTEASLDIREGDTLHNISMWEGE